jgi:hypothetical protein
MTCRSLPGCVVCYHDGSPIQLHSEATRYHVGNVQDSTGQNPIEPTWKPKRRASKVMFLLDMIMFLEVPIFSFAVLIPNGYPSYSNQTHGRIGLSTCVAPVLRYVQPSTQGTSPRDLVPIEWVKSGGSRGGPVVQQWVNPTVWKIYLDFWEPPFMKNVILLLLYIYYYY